MTENGELVLHWPLQVQIWLLHSLVLVWRLLALNAHRSTLAGAHNTFPSHIFSTSMFFFSWQKKLVNKLLSVWITIDAANERPSGSDRLSTSARVSLLPSGGWRCCCNTDWEGCKNRNVHIQENFLHKLLQNSLSHDGTVETLWPPLATYCPCRVRKTFTNCCQPIRSPNPNTTFQPIRDRNMCIAPIAF